jgi:hypothetical protein
VIRKAHLGDVPALYVLGRRIHMKSDDRDVPMDEAVVRGTLAELITSSRGLVLVDEVDGLVTGVVAGFVDQLWWSKKRYAITLIAYAERTGAIAWMVKRFIRWAFDQKCASQVVLDVSFGGQLGQKTQEIYERLGFEKVGASFIVRPA